jgi:hypothetical protein
MNTHHALLKLMNTHHSCLLGGQDAHPTRGKAEVNRQKLEGGSKSVILPRSLFLLALTVDPIVEAIAPFGQGCFWRRYGEVVQVSLQNVLLARS